MRVEQEKAVSTAEQHDTAETKDVRLAQQAAQDEHALTFLGAMRKYWKAAMWSMLLSTSIVMEGYDIVLVSSFYAQPAFTRRYGEYDPGSDSYQISSSWQSGFNGAISIGTIIGAFANGYFTYRWGYRKVLLVSLGLIAAFIFMTFFAPNLGVLLAGELLCGIPWGVFATMGPAYASEVCPLALRGYLAVYVNLCWAFGQLISAGVQSGFSTNDTEWAYRAPFAIQWVWPIPLFVVLWFAPESPWHHVRRGEYAEAEQMITRLSNDRQQLHSKETLAMMIHTNDLERSMDAGTSYLDCFRGIDRRRTEIACMAFAAQPFCGSAIAGTPTYFFVQAGIATSISFTLSVGGLGLASVGTILSWFLMGRFGRRTLYLWGLGLLSLILFTVGFVSVGQGGTQAGNYAQAALMLLWLLVYYMTVGPICYAIIGESSSTRLRNKSVCLSRIAYYIAQVISNVISPQMLNPTAGNWKGKTGFFWGGCAALFFVWTFFRLPESKDRTFEELDLLYAKGISARHFSSYKVDAYVEGGEAVVKED